MVKRPKYTPTNCRLKKCRYNYLAPEEESQECIGCPGLISQKWMPNRENWGKHLLPGETRDMPKSLTDPSVKLGQPGKEK